jgi:hypothetical protein
MPSRRPPLSSQGDWDLVEGRSLGHIRRRSLHRSEPHLSIMACPSLSFRRHIAEHSLRDHSLFMSRRFGRARVLPPGPAIGYEYIRQKTK